MFFWCTHGPIVYCRTKIRSWNCAMQSCLTFWMYQLMYIVRDKISAYIGMASKDIRGYHGSDTPDREILCFICYFFFEELCNRWVVGTWFYWDIKYILKKNENSPFFPISKGFLATHFLPLNEFIFIVVGDVFSDSLPILSGLILGSHDITSNYHVYADDLHVIFGLTDWQSGRRDTFDEWHPWFGIPVG